MALLFMLPAILSTVMVAGCTGTDKTVKTGDTVSVNYIGTFTDGSVFDTSVEKVAKEGGVYNSERDYKPLSFIVGAGKMIKGFDDAVVGMKLNESKNITITPEQAYGNYDPALIRPVPIKQLTDMGITPEVNMTLYAGNTPVKIVAINQTNSTVDVDFNHPMAGKTLQFSITVVDIKSS